MSAQIKHFPSTTNIKNLSLKELADSANREANLGDECFVKGLEHYKQCGEFLIAAKAKGKAEIGSSFRWGEWLKENFSKSHDLANKYVRIAEKWEKIRTSSDFSDDIGLKSALKLLSIQPETVDVEVVEKEVVKENPETKQKLSGAEKKLAEVSKRNADLEKRLKDLENRPPQQITVVDETEAKENQKLRQVLEGMQNQIVTLESKLAKQVTQRPPEPQIVEVVKEVEKVVEVDSAYKEMYEKLELDYAELKANAGSEITNSDKVVVSKEEYEYLSMIDRCYKDELEYRKNSYGDPSSPFGHLVYTCFNVAERFVNGGSISADEQLQIARQIMDLTKKYL